MSEHEKEQWMLDLEKLQAETGNPTLWNLAFDAAYCLNGMAIVKEYDPEFAPMLQQAFSDYSVILCKLAGINSTALITLAAKIFAIMNTDEPASALN